MINIYIGVSKETLVPAAVLKQSIKKTSNKVRVFDCPVLNIPNLNSKSSTPFSFNRLSIPLHEHFEECDWAIYLDSGGNIKSESESIPCGGSLISLCGETIITNSQHYDLLPSELR